MSSRADIAAGRGFSSTPVRTRVVEVSTTNVDGAINTTIVLPNVRRMCAVLCFFIGSFAAGFGAGFGTGFAAKICEAVAS
jgi:hypothetical protein